MYNGGGLAAVRGSGSNGFVQKNPAPSAKRTKDRGDYRMEADAARVEKRLNRQLNADIISHDRKRRVELKCMEYQESLEEQKELPLEVIAKMVSKFRDTLMWKEGVSESGAGKDDQGRPTAKDSHQLAEANQKNQRLPEAFGLKDSAEGSTGEATSHAREEADNAMAAKKQGNGHGSKSEEEEADEEEQPAKKKKKKSRGESSSPERGEKRRKHKKHRHSRPQ